MTLPRINIPFTTQGSTNGDDEDLLSIFPSLTYKERLIGFGVCLILGILVSLSSYGAFSDLLLGYPVRFAVLYSLGNLISLCSTMFLVGPRQQYKNMSHHSRRTSAAIYVGCLFVTPLIAYSLPEVTWVIILLVMCQWSALMWYTLSYIPFGRRMAAGLARRLLG
jgi:hypothetical protein